MCRSGWRGAFFDSVIACRRWRGQCGLSLLFRERPAIHAKGREKGGRGGEGRVLERLGEEAREDDEVGSRGGGSFGRQEAEMDRSTGSKFTVDQWRLRGPSG